jgi:hypothetical protein
MLSGKLIRLIESHSDEITRRTIRQIHEDPELPHLKKVPDSELRERWQVISRNLGQWLAAGRKAKLISDFEELGGLRFREHIPLHEVVRAHHIVRNTMIDFLQEQGLPQTTTDVYAEEELEQRVTRFFDELVCHLVWGYEEARKAAPASSTGR